MQTFLPYHDFRTSALCLDKKRCWKQVIEASQIIGTLTGKWTAWKNHPVARMWRKYLPALISYYNVFWETSVNKHSIRVVKMQPIYTQENIVLPLWLGDEKVHASHRSNLLRKNIEFYSKYNWVEPDNMPYYWPVPLK
jgi:hypothetical protein